MIAEQHEVHFAFFLQPCGAVSIPDLAVKLRVLFIPQTSLYIRFIYCSLSANSAMAAYFLSRLKICTFKPKFLFSLKL